MTTVALNLNFSQISFDSSKKIIDIHSKCAYDKDEFHRIVGAVTIIFTDSGLCATNSKGTESRIDNKKVWKNIPSSLSILPSPNCEGVQGVGGEAQYADIRISDEVVSDERSTVIKQEPLSPIAEDGINSSFISADDSKPVYPDGNGAGMRVSQDKVMGKDVPFEKNSVENHLSPRCKVCLREICNRKEFNFHSKSHMNVLGGKESCPICLKSFQRRMHLLRHSFVHFTNTLYCCPICQIKIARMDSFRRHFHKRHPASLPQLRWYLANYKKSASIRQNYQEANEQGIKRTSAIHKSPDVFPVPVSETVGQAQNMKVDIDAEGKERVNIVTSGVGKLEVGEVFAVKELNSKKQSQTGVIRGSQEKKTSKCSFCFSEMSNLEDFINHMEAHKAIMKVPYTCPVCLHEFSDKMRVKRHASKHVQTDMYVCPICHLQVPRVDSFRRHVRKVHRQNSDDISLLVKHSLSPSGVTERLPETEGLSINSFVLSSDGYTALSTNDMNIKQEVGAYDFTAVKSNVIFKQEVTSEDDNIGDKTSYNICNEDTWRPTTTYESNTAKEYTSEYHHQNQCPETSFQEMQIQPRFIDTAPQKSVKHKRSMTDKSPSPHGDSETDDCSLPGMTFTVATFNAPKRGGYRLSRTTTQTSTKSESLVSQASSVQGQGSCGQKHQNKNVSSICFFCSSRLTNVRQFLQHASLHAEEGKNTCPVCVTDYARKLGLVRHSVNHVPSDSHTCDVCGTCFSRRDVMLRHYRNVHKICPTYIRQDGASRDLGSATFVDDDLPTLSFSSISAPNIPPMPGESNTLLSAEGSVSMVDEDDVMYSCGLCGAQYHDAQALQDHVQNHPHDI